MTVINLRNEVLLRLRDNFKQKRILFAGDIQDKIPVDFVCSEKRIYTQFYDHWQVLSQQIDEVVHFGLIAKKSDIANCDTLIYFWQKNKLEAEFQLMNLLSLLPFNCEIFVIGENRSGVRSVESMLEKWVRIHKIDSARRCSLYYGSLKKHPSFFIKNYWGEYKVDGLTIKSLPGVFNRVGLDVGTQLLISTFKSNTMGKVLEVGCGTGVLSSVLLKHSPKIQLTLCDVNAAAIEATRATLASNEFSGIVLASNVYSNIFGRYDLIISNPPFHKGLKTNFLVAKRLIQGAVQHLNFGGELRIVANKFLPYPKMLDETFGFHDVIAQNSNFKVYRILMTN